MGNIVNIIKLIFTGLKPGKEVVEKGKELGGSGWKTPAAWATFLSSILAFVLAVKGFIPAVVGAVIIAVVTGGYNAVRAFINTEQSGIQNPLLSTRFWTTVVGVLLTMLTDIQTAGVGGKVIAALVSGLTAIGAGAQSIGANQPDPES